MHVVRCYIANLDVMLYYQSVDKCFAVDVVVCLVITVVIVVAVPVTHKCLSAAHTDMRY